jgi:hypothetical protein
MTVKQTQSGAPGRDIDYRNDGKNTGDFSPQSGRSIAKNYSRQTDHGLEKPFIGLDVIFYKKYHTWAAETTVIAQFP